MAIEIPNNNPHAIPAGIPNDAPYLQWKKKPIPKPKGNPIAIEFLMMRDVILFMPNDELYHGVESRSDVTELIPAP